MRVFADQVTVFHVPVGELVVEHRLEDWEAAELAPELAYGLAKRAYRL